MKNIMHEYGNVLVTIPFILTIIGIFIYILDVVTS